jgi:glutathionyl-hydroquinone reductase
MSLLTLITFACSTSALQDINNGAYKAGFANEQEAYEKAYDTFFAALDRVEFILQGKKFLTGDRCVVRSCMCVCVFVCVCVCVCVHDRI